MLGICPDLTARRCKQLRWTPAWRKFHLQTNTSFLTLSVLDFHACLREKPLYLFTERILCIHQFYEPWPEAVGSSRSDAARGHCEFFRRSDAAATLAFWPRARPAQHFVCGRHGDARAAAVVQASEWKIKQMNNTELLDMTAELCNSRTALLD